MVTHSMFDISVIIPIYNGGSVLPVVLERIEACVSFLSQYLVEVILVVTPDEDNSEAIARTFAKSSSWKLLIVHKRGKAHALQEGVRYAKGLVLIFMDADVLVDLQALGHLIEPILLLKQADVALGHPVPWPNAQRNALSVRLEKWGEISMEAWDLLRSRYPDLLWALPGYLYAIRRDFFPSDITVPLLDDASIGLSAKKLGARFVYCREAQVAVQIPATYLDWCRQKVRTRQGWELLARHDKNEFDALQRGLQIVSATMLLEGDWLMHLLKIHDRFLRIIAKMSAVNSDYWSPVKSTKDFNVK